MSSDPSQSRSPLPILDPLQAPPPTLPLSRDYRKGNWTVHETLILITAKRLDDDRRSRSNSTPTTSFSPPRSAEQRWKWVENYCWKQGCHRSQNQCNDKWDNLLRDYKKVRDYQSRPTTSSYWSLDRHDRKARNLPTNLSLEVFEALTDVLNRRASLRTPAPPPPPPPQAITSGEMTPEGSSETEGSSEAAGGKRRRGIGSSVMRGAAELARAMMACEERKERRHRDLMELEERRLRMEENRTEMNRQAVAGLIAAVGGLSAAIHSLVADHRGGHGR